MRARARCRIAIRLAIVVILAAALPAAPAFATPAPADDTVEVSLQAGPGSETDLSVPLFLDPTIVPGDQDHRTIVVTNAGELSGTLVATLVNVKLAGDRNDPYYGELMLAGQPVSALNGNETGLARRTLAPGESTSLDIGYHFPEESMAGNHPQRGAVLVSFDVLVTLSGDLPDEPVSPPDSSLASTGFGGVLLPVAALLGAAGLGLTLANAASGVRRLRKREPRAPRP